MANIDPFDGVIVSDEQNPALLEPANLPQPGELPQDILDLLDPNPVPPLPDHQVEHIQQVQDYARLVEQQAQGLRQYLAQLQAGMPRPEQIRTQQNMAEQHVQEIQGYMDNLGRMQQPPEPPAARPRHRGKPAHLRPPAEIAQLLQDQAFRGEARFRQLRRGGKPVRRHQAAPQVHQPVAADVQRREAQINVGQAAGQQGRRHQAAPQVNQPPPAAANVQRREAQANVGQAAVQPGGRHPGGRQARYLPRADGRFECPQCRNDFKSAASLRTHISRLHNQAYVCPEDDCGQVLTSRQNLEEHQTHHRLPPGPNACTYGRCTYSCIGQGNLTRHIQAAHQNQHN